MKLSLCMITKDEEDFLAAALESVKDLVDEMIIVDTGSTDKTVEIAKQFTDNVFYKEWTDNYSEARNYSLTKATGDWILILDADEVIATEDHATIKQFIADEAYDAYSLVQANYMDDLNHYNYRPITDTTYAKNFTGYVPVNIVRLFRKKDNIRFQGAIHEFIEGNIDKQRIKETNIMIHHYQYAKGQDKQHEKQLKALKIYEKNIENYPDKARAYRDMGIINLMFVKNYAQAVTYLQQSLRFKQHPKTYVALGMALEQQNNTKAALQTYKQGLQQFPEHKHLQQLYQTTRQKLKQNSYSFTVQYGD